MATRPTRVPEDVHDEVQSIARVLGQSPGELLERAWRVYRETPEFRKDFARVQKAFVAGDLDSITSLLTDRGRRRAQERTGRVKARRLS